MIDAVDLSLNDSTLCNNDSIEIVLPNGIVGLWNNSVHEKLVGDQDYYFDASTGVNYFAKREVKLSLDIDFSKLPIKKPWLKAVVKQFNYLKIPFPTVIYRGGDFVGSWSGW